MAAVLPYRKARRRWKQGWGAKGHWKPPEAGSEARMGPPLEPSERMVPCRHLDFRLRASETVRECISVVLYSPVCDNSPSA